MNFYRVMIDIGKKKKFACGCLTKNYNSKLTVCSGCGIEWNMPGGDIWFNDKTWEMEIYLDREYYADFINSQIREIISKKAKNVFINNFNNAVDFGEIKMISCNELTEQQIKKIKDYYGYAAIKNIPNNPPQYYRLLLKQGADLDFIKSNVRLVLDCPECGRKDYSRSYDHIGDPLKIFIIESTWKGYDIFHVEGMGNTVFCTEQFIDVYNQNELKGLEFNKIITV